jgi:hypothetical protein
MQLVWEEILKSSELTKLIFKRSGLSKKEWNEIIKEEDYDSIENDLNQLLDDTECIIYSTCVSMGYDSSYRLINLCGLFFWNDHSADLGWEGPESSIREFYDLGWFFGEADNTNYEVSTSLDDETIFKIIGECNCPITINDIKYIHDGERYVKA